MASSAFIELRGQASDVGTSILVKWDVQPEYLLVDIGTALFFSKHQYTKEDGEIISHWETPAENVGNFMYQIARLRYNICNSLRVIPSSLENTVGQMTDFKYFVCFKEKYVKVIDLSDSSEKYYNFDTVIHEFTDLKVNYHDRCEEWL